MYFGKRTVLCVTALLLCALSLSVLLAGCEISSNDAAGYQVREYMKQGMSQDQAVNEYLIRDLMYKENLTREQAKAKLIEEAKRVQEEYLSEDSEVQQYAASQPGVYNLDPMADPDNGIRQTPETGSNYTSLNEWLDYLDGTWEKYYDSTYKEETLRFEFAWSAYVEAMLRAGGTASVENGNLVLTGDGSVTLIRIDDDHLRAVTPEDTLEYARIR